MRSTLIDWLAIPSHLLSLVLPAYLHLLDLYDSMIQPCNKPHINRSKNSPLACRSTVHFCVQTKHNQLRFYGNSPIRSFSFILNNRTHSVVAHRFIIILRNYEDSYDKFVHFSVVSFANQRFLTASSSLFIKPSNL